MTVCAHVHVYVSTYCTCASNIEKVRMYMYQILALTVRPLSLLT